LLNKQSADFNNRLINRFFSILLYLPKPFFDTRKTGDLVARMNNARRIQNTISFLGGNVIIDVLVVLISTFYVFQYQTGIGLLSLLSIPIYFLLMRLYHKDVRNSQREVMSAYAQNESNYTFPRWRRTYTFIRWAKAIAGIGARLVPPTATSAP
jgi:ATP-binding cassette subfamily B protein